MCEADSDKEGEGRKTNFFSLEQLFRFFNPDTFSFFLFFSLIII
jgi:hypothetical protein